MYRVQKIQIAHSCNKLCIMQQPRGDLWNFSIYSVPDIKYLVIFPWNPGLIPIS